MRRHVMPGRPMAIVIAAKVGIVVLVLALPSGLALSVGVAHGVVLLLLGVAVVVLLATKVVRSRRPEPARPGERHMLTAVARISTANASRYLGQLCRHANKISHLPRHATHARPEVLGVDWSDTHGTLDLSWGKSTLDAGSTTLTVCVEAADEENLRRVQDIIAADLERFGRRDQLTVTWRLDEGG